MAPVHAAAQSATFVAPPRTIADITAILDQEKPDPAAVRKMRAAAETAPPLDASRAALAKFHFNRSEARVRLGDYRGALADGQQALEIGEGAVPPRQIEGIRRHVALIYLSMGDPKNALEVFLSIAQTRKDRS
jgi:tetratricopeptide (TPR) repeat protein